MRNLKNISKVFLFLLVLTALSCNKNEETLILDSVYFNVSDLSQYCSGSCDEIYDWENKPALVKGYVKGVENDSLMQEFYSKSLFYLEDIRTGVFIEIRITDDKDAIFGKLYSIQKTDMIYMKGVATPVISDGEGGCIKGMFLLIDSAGSISVEGS